MLLLGYPTPGNVQKNRPFDTGTPSHPRGATNSIFLLALNTDAPTQLWLYNSLIDV